MSCIEIGVLWLYISICRPEAAPQRLSSASGGAQQTRPKAPAAPERRRRAQGGPPGSSASGLPVRAQTHAK